MFTLTGTVQDGLQHFSKLMNKYSEVFKKATGEKLFPGTINVNVKQKVEINEHFRIKGAEINTPKQDLLFEVCKINDIWAYRVRPYSLRNSKGGYGDHIIEIVCSKKISNANIGDTVELTFF